MSSSAAPCLQNTRESARIRSSLLAAAPLNALLATLTRDIDYIRSRLPTSADLGTLQRLREDLARALDEAKRTDVWLSPSEIADHTGKGLSTVTKECREIGEVAGAVRNGKRSWRVHWPTYEEWMVSTGRGRNAE